MIIWVKYESCPKINWKLKVMEDKVFQGAALLSLPQETSWGLLENTTWSIVCLIHFPFFPRHPIHVVLSGAGEQESGVRQIWVEFVLAFWAQHYSLNNDAFSLCGSLSFFQLYIYIPPQIQFTIQDLKYFWKIWSMVNFRPQKCNKGTNSTPLLHTLNFGLFIRLTGKCISVTNLEQYKTTTIFIWDALWCGWFQYIK